MDEGGRRKEVNVSHRKRRKSGVWRKARREGDEPRAQKDAEEREEENGTKNGVNTEYIRRTKQNGGGGGDDARNDRTAQRHAQNGLD